MVYKCLDVVDGWLVLDMGCGMGEFLEHLPGKLGKWGVDIDPDCVRVSKKHNPDGIFFEGDATALTLESHKFDLVTAICLLEHVDNPTKLIEEAHRVCKKGGIGVFVTPNLGRPLRMWKAICRQESWDRSGHKQGWDHHLLKLCLQNNGWKVEKIITKVVDCPLYERMPRRIGDYMSRKLLMRLFPRIGSELYAFCRK